MAANSVTNPHLIDSLHTFADFADGRHNRFDTPMIGDNDDLHR